MGRSQHWRIVLNLNQDRLGKVFMVLARHETDVVALLPDETADLWATLRTAKRALVAAFQPDHFNYMFLMNQDPHVHLHVVPRYHTLRTFADLEFPVLDSLDGAQFRPPAPVFRAIGEAIVSHVPPRALNSP